MNVRGDTPTADFRIPLEPSADERDSSIRVAAVDRAPVRQSHATRRLEPVLHLVNGEHYAGAERVQDLLALRLPALGFQVDFGCVKQGVFAAVRESQGAQLWEFHMRSRVDFTVVSHLVALVRRNGYRIVHTHTPRTAMLGRAVASIAGVPMIHHLHSPSWLDTQRPMRDMLNAAAERMSLVGASAVIAVSSELLRYGQRVGIPRERLRLVPNGVPTPGPLPEPRIPKQEWVLGSVGLFRPRKGLETLVDALASLRVDGHPCRLRLVGAFESPSYEALIRARVDRLGLGSIVDRVGFTRDVHRQLLDMDLFVMPSRQAEGHPMAAIEAMAAGVPVIATRLEGISEMLGHGRYGLLVTPDRPAELARTVERVIRGEVDWVGLRRRAFARQRSYLSDTHMAEQVATVYREVLKP